MCYRSRWLPVVHRVGAPTALDPSQHQISVLLAPVYVDPTFIIIQRAILGGVRCQLVKDQRDAVHGVLAAADRRPVDRKPMSGITCELFMRPDNCPDQLNKV